MDVFSVRVSRDTATDVREALTQAATERGLRVKIVERGWLRRLLICTVATHDKERAHEYKRAAARLTRRTPARSAK
jgi:hypothetical protein